MLASGDATRLRLGLYIALFSAKIKRQRLPITQIHLSFLKNNCTIANALDRFSRLIKTSQFDEHR